MGRVAGLVLVVLLVGCGVAHGARGGGQSGKASWDAVEGLGSDALVEVLPENQAGPDTCRIAFVDDSSLTCIREDLPQPVRLVYPRAAVRDVWVMDPVHDRHVVKWVFVTVGVGLGIALCVANPLVGSAIVGMVLLGIESPVPSYRMPPPPMPRPPRFRWRLVYGAP